MIFQGYCGFQCTHRQNGSLTRTKVSQIYQKTSSSKIIKSFNSSRRNLTMRHPRTEIQNVLVIITIKEHRCDLNKMTTSNPKFKIYMNEKFPDSFLGIRHQKCTDILSSLQPHPSTKIKVQKENFTFYLFLYNTDCMPSSFEARSRA